MATLAEIDTYIKQCVVARDDAALAKQEYVAFGEDGGASLSTRDLDRNKDIALVLKMVSAVYDIPISKVYNDIGGITCAPCVTCGEHRPQRVALLCYYCAKGNNATMAELVETYLAKHRMAM